MSAAIWILAVGSIFSLVSLGFVAISFATDNWIVVTVDRDRSMAENGFNLPTTNGWYFSRNRGLFRTCYTGNETKFLDNAPGVVDGNCLRIQGYEINRNPNTISYGSDYETRIHLMRSHFGFMIGAMFFLIVGALAGIVGCWQLKVMVLQVAGLLVFIGAFFAAGGMAFFHGYDYLEREKLKTDTTIGDFKGYILGNVDALTKISFWAYGYSYILGWIGVGCAGIGAMLYLCASFSVSSKLAKEKRHERKKFKPTSFDAGYGNGYGNSGYMEDPYSAYAGGYGAQPYYPTAGPYPSIGY